jgi:prevent-host-death family protein
MTEIDVLEAKNMLGTLLDRVGQGEEIIITRHGNPVARLVPNQGGINRQLAEAAAKRIRERAVQIQAGPFEWKNLKRDRETGRS